MAEISFETLGTCPVPGETPAGDDCRYEPEYAAVLEEIEKLSFSGQGTAASWPAIEKNAVIILSEKSKDLQIASYLGVALWQNRGLDGMLDGMRVLLGFLETFWETGWPSLKRMRARVNAVDWWHERTYGFLQDAATNAPPIRSEQQKALLDGLEKLDELVSSLLPDASPLRDLVAAARRLPLVQEDQAPEEQPPEEQPSGEQRAEESSAVPQTATPEPATKQAPLPPVSSPLPAAPAAGPESDDPAVLRRHFTTAGLAYLAAARRAEPGDASLWHLSRLIVWGGIASLPASEDGQTLLPAPDMDALSRARQKLETGSALEAALDAEAFFVTAPFCMDAQATAHAALSALGPKFADAARRVAEESARFFARLPGMEKLSFIDGTPFVSPGTFTWLRQSAPGSPGSPGASGGSEPSTAGDEQYEAAVAAARDLMARNELAGALAVLDEAKTESPASNLRLRAYQARLLREGGKTGAALAMAEALVQEVSSRDLDNWDPKLALLALIAARNAFILDEPHYERELRDVRRRIARLCPGALE